MAIEPGIIFALGAFLCWGVGDFLLQRSSRSIGSLHTLFILSAVGFIGLTPFVWQEVATLFTFQDNTLFFLLIAALVLFTAAILDFEALKTGKLAIVEPMFSLEVPVAAGMAILVLGERVSLVEGLLIAAIVVGLVLVSMRDFRLRRKDLFERGVVIALLAAIFFGLANFFVGFTSRIAHPLLVNWFLCLVHIVLTLVCIVMKGELPQLGKEFLKSPLFSVSFGLIDIGAWVSFTFATSLTTIPIVVAISESYILLAVMLGVVINRERLVLHQTMGLVLALAGVITLATIVG